VTGDPVRGFMYVLGAFAVYIYGAGDALMQENSAIATREDR
jgi:hypothetical protein